jgi:molybdopterin-guanine dinucleotide biosynthesis protein A
MTRVLGAVLAGGGSRRFGSDKASAVLGDRTLLDRVVAVLLPQVNELVICGRQVEGIACVADRPAPDLGPLGGLNAALHEARRRGCDMVVSVPCDTPFLPADLVARLSGVGRACYVASLPVIGAWPCALADGLDRHLAESEDRSMRLWVATLEAAPIEFGAIDNVNTMADLELLTKSVSRRN